MTPAPQAKPLSRLVVKLWLLAPIPAALFMAGIGANVFRSQATAGSIFGLVCAALTLLLGVGGAVLSLVACFGKEKNRKLGALSVVFMPVFVAISGFVGIVSAMGGGHGRPFRVRGRPTRARGQKGRDWAGDVSVDTRDLTHGEREELARLWLDDALVEHASIAAFAQLSQELLAVGAPPALLLGCHRAAGDEVRHAQLAFAFASAYAGKSLSPGPLPEASCVGHQVTGSPTATQSPRTGGGAQSSALTHEQRLVMLAQESLADGYLNEGIAARVLALASQQAQHGPMAHALATMAEDEARHTALARDILLFCLETGGAPVRAALEHTLEHLHVGDWGRDGGPDLPCLPAHGRPARADVSALAQAQLQAVQLEARAHLSSLPRA